MRLTASLLVLIPALAFSASAGLLTHWGLVSVADLVRGLHRRFSRRYRLDRVLGRVTSITAEQQSSRRLPVPFMVGLGAGLALAVAWHHPVISPWWMVLGGLAGWMLVSTRPSLQRETLRDLETLVSGVRAMYIVGQSVFGPLEAVAQDLPSGSELRIAVEEAVRRHRAGRTVDESLGVLKGRWSFLDRLILILSESSLADTGSVRDALLGLEEQIQKSRNLLDRARVVLTVNLLTLRVLQVANLVAIVVVTVIPTWHRFFAARPAMLVAATLAGLLGSWYFASEMRRIEELI
jgi:hypothetical protein